MKTFLLLLVTLITTLGFSQEETTCLTIAKSFQNQFTSGDYQKAGEHFDPELMKTVTPQVLETIWGQLETKAGKYTYSGEISSETIKKSLLTIQPLHFEKEILDLKLSFSEDNLIEGVFFAPHKIKTLDLVETEAFQEVSFTLKTSKEIKLPGILTLPKEGENHPALVLVHGSGPNDMDETLGPNKLFKDLAHALASKGIAVYRYEKRTKHYSGSPLLDVSTLTLYEETIEDAVNAVKLLGKDKRLDKKNIFVLGHSLGGMAAPQIINESKKVAGIIILGGNARPLEEVIADQYAYLFMEDGEISKEEQKTIENYNRQLEELNKMRNGENYLKYALPLGLSEAYWEYLLQYDQVGVAQKIKQPILIVQGERDYQITLKEFAIWKEKLQSKENVSYLSYPKLNHLFRPGLGEGNSYPNEYELEQPLPTKIIDDISEWILNSAYPDTKM